MTEPFLIKFSLRVRQVLCRRRGVEAAAANMMKSPSSSPALQRVSYRSAHLYTKSASCAVFGVESAPTGLAGSLITVMTGLPVTSEIAESSSGSVRFFDPSAPDSLLSRDARFSSERQREYRLAATVSVASLQALAVNA